jgi:hypothetical protein
MAESPFSCCTFTPIHMTQKMGREGQDTREGKKERERGGEGRLEYHQRRSIDPPSTSQHLKDNRQA